MRMLEIYSVANSLGIGYLHRPITCVGHIGDLVHYRESACNLTREADVRLLKKIRRMITLPSTVSEEQVRHKNSACRTAAGAAAAAPGAIRLKGVLMTAA
jgi:hypothetical protein